MAFIDDYGFEQLKNEAEQLVYQELEVQLADAGEDICRCNDCVMDMAAMALNNVKPLYHYSILGNLYAAQAKSNQTYADSVQQQVAQAIAKVSSNPSHD
jgi:competence protein ComFB